MSDGMTLAGVPAREDCPSCPETGDRCALHESMYLRVLERQQELDAIDQTQQAYVSERGGHDDQRVNEQPSMSETLSKTLAREKNRLKTQEGQMISVSACLFSCCGFHDHQLRIRDSLFGQYLLFAGFEENELRGKTARSH